MLQAFRAEGSGSRVYGLGVGVGGGGWGWCWGAGCKVQGAGFGMHGAGFLPRRLGSRTGHKATSPDTSLWSSSVPLPQNLEGHATEFAPHKALMCIAWCELTFDERVELNRWSPDN